MAKELNISADKQLIEKSELFLKNVSSEMHFKSELTNDLMSFDWLNEIEFACPYLDNIIRNPKLALIQEEDIVKIEKVRKVAVASIKNLSRNTHYIEKINKQTNEVQPSKLLIVRNEETFNTYENRFIYTLVNNLSRFMMKKEAQLDAFETKSDKVLEYAASTNTGSERVNIELKISSKEMTKGQELKDFKKEIAAIKARIKKIREYMGSWQKSEFIKSLEKAHVPFLLPPIKKTNIILKNPNFQIAMKLWGFLYVYDYKDNDSTKDSLDTAGDNILRGILDNSFLMDYFTLDSISSSRQKQKEMLAKYAVIMISKQIQRAVSLLLNNGIKISDEEIINMVSSEISNEKSKRLIGSADVKNKFKSALDEYMERTQDYL